MIIASRTRSPLLPDAPAYARRVGLRCWISNKVVEFRGRRDTRQEPDGNGLFATTLALHRQVDQVAGQIDDSLRMQLQLVDWEIATLFGQQERWCSALEDVRVRQDHLQAANRSDGSLEADENERALREVGGTVAGLVEQINAAEANIGNLAQRRHHLNAAARDIADTWSSRCDELVALHRRGYLRRSTEAPRDSTRHVSKYAWAHDDMLPVSIALTGLSSPLQRRREAG